MSWETVWETSESAPKKSFELLPKGKYQAVIESASLDTTKTPHIAYEYKVISGEYKNRKVWTRKYLTQDAVPYTKTELETAFGGPVPSTSISSALSSLQGKKVEIYVTVKEATDNFKAQNQATINSVLDPTFEESFDSVPF